MKLSCTSILGIIAGVVTIGIIAVKLTDSLGDWFPLALFALIVVIFALIVKRVNSQSPRSCTQCPKRGLKFWWKVETTNRCPKCGSGQIQPECGSPSIVVCADCNFRWYELKLIKHPCPAIISGLFKTGKIT